MASIDIYTTRFCPFCVRAKQLLGSKGLAFNEIPVDGDAKLRQQMTKKAGGSHTVPQIWVNSVYVGGCTELIAADRSGELDRLLEK